jgi:hypothetical protein
LDLTTKGHCDPSEGREPWNGEGKRSLVWSEELVGGKVLEKYDIDFLVSMFMLRGKDRNQWLERDPGKVRQVFLCSLEKWKH